MTIADNAVLVTGANRGLGQALVTEAPSSGARRVDAGTRRPLARPDGRVRLLPLDVTQRGADPDGRRSVRVDNPQLPPAGYEQRGTQVEMAWSREEPMHDRILDRLTWLAAALSLGHHLDHLIPSGELGGTPRSR